MYELKQNSVNQALPVGRGQKKMSSEMFFILPFSAELHWSVDLIE